MFSCFSAAAKELAPVFSIVVQSYPLFSFVLLHTCSSNCCSRIHAFPVLLCCGPRNLCVSPPNGLNSNLMAVLLTDLFSEM